MNYVELLIYISESREVINLNGLRQIKTDKNLYLRQTDGSWIKEENVPQEIQQEK